MTKTYILLTNQPLSLRRETCGQLQWCRQNLLVHLCANESIVSTSCLRHLMFASVDSSPKPNLVARPTSAKNDLLQFFNIQNWQKSWAFDFIHHLYPPTKQNFLPKHVRVSNHSVEQYLALEHQTKTLPQLTQNSLEPSAWFSPICCGRLLSIAFIIPSPQKSPHRSGLPLQGQARDAAPGGAIQPNGFSKPPSIPIGYMGLIFLPTFSWFLP